MCTCNKDDHLNAVEMPPLMLALSHLLLIIIPNTFVFLWQLVLYNRSSSRLTRHDGCEKAWGLHICGL